MSKLYFKYKVGKKFNESDYYYHMANLGDTFEDIHKNWYNCFSTILKTKFIGFNDLSISTLFYHFDMLNWKALHKENTEYCNTPTTELIEIFKADVNYISDRVSLDRLFRVHWLFLNAFPNELNRIKYPNLYKD